MEGPSNGGLLYHEVQEGKLCAVHCVNTVLQGPFFSEVDLASLASDLDQKERQMMVLDGRISPRSRDFLTQDSHNVSLDGNFSIQVLQKALEFWDLQVISFDSSEVSSSKYEPDMENAFICHLLDHWFCIRKVNGEWYNFNSLYPAPEHLSKFYLSAYLDTLKCSGWSIFLARGNFPKDCPIPSNETFNAFGQWLTPEDAQRITKCSQTQGAASSYSHSSEFINESNMLAEEDDDDDLNAAIQASLMESGFQAPDKIAEEGSPVDLTFSNSHSVHTDEKDAGASGESIGTENQDSQKGKSRHSS